MRATQQNEILVPFGVFLYKICVEQPRHFYIGGISRALDIASQQACDNFSEKLTIYMYFTPYWKTLAKSLAYKIQTLWKEMPKNYYVDTFWRFCSIKPQIQMFTLAATTLFALSRACIFHSSRCSKNSIRKLQYNKTTSQLDNLRENRAYLPCCTFRNLT